MLSHTDLEELVDCLDGLVILLEDLSQREVGSSANSPLLDALMSPERLTNVWEAARYQPGVGLGWDYTADSVRALRSRVAEELRR